MRGTGPSGWAAPPSEAQTRRARHTRPARGVCTPWAWSTRRGAWAARPRSG